MLQIKLVSFSDLLRKFMLITLLFSGITVHAELADTSLQKMRPFTELVNSDLSASETADTLRRAILWDWRKFTPEEFQFMTYALSEKIQSCKSMSQEYYLEEYLKDMYVSRVELGKAVVQYEKLIAICSALRDTNKIIHNYYHLSWLMMTNGLPEQGLNTYKDLMKIVETTADSAGYSSYCWSYGYFYTLAGWETKKPEYQDSAVKYLGINYNFVIAHPEYRNFESDIMYAMALARSKNYRKALTVGHRALKQAYINNDPLYIARFNKQISQYYMSLEMKDSSYYHIMESAQYDQLAFPNDPLLVKVENGKGILHLYNVPFLLMHYWHFGEFEKSSVLLDHVLYKNHYNDPIIMDLYKMGGEHYFKNKEFEKAAECYSKYSELSDSTHQAVINTYNEVSSAQLSTQIELEQQKARFEKHQMDLLAKEEKEHLRTIILFAIIGSIGLIIFLVVVYRRFRITRKQKVVIENQKILVEDAFKQVNKQNREILDSIAYAKRIQTAILPPQSLIDKLLPETFIFYKPKDIVAGDFYWVEKKEDKVLFAACDCTGHGVPGAMVSVICNNGLNRSVREYNITTPSAILNKTREIVVQEFEKSEEELKDGMDVALCSLSTTPHGGVVLEYAGANNPLWLIRKDSKEVTEFKADKQPIGKFHNSEPYTNHKIELRKGDTIYVFSDGFADQFSGETRKRFKSGPFKELLVKINHLSMEDQKTALYQTFTTWKGTFMQIDDICVIGVRI